jgi:hypothetical protein
VVGGCGGGGDVMRDREKTVQLYVVVGTDIYYVYIISIFLYMCLLLRNSLLFIYVVTYVYVVEVFFLELFVKSGSNVCVW